jgi:hypothetical protein
VRKIAPRAACLAAFAALTLVAACATAPPNNIDNACQIFKQRHSWYRAAQKAEHRWGVPDYVIMAIIRQESGFKHNARPKRGRFLFVFPGARPSSAYGYPQAVDSTWDYYKRSTNHRGASRRNFHDAADFVGWYANKVSRAAGIAKTDAFHLYLAYHEGAANYRRGTYRGKGWLIRAARRVDTRAANYRAQLDRCNIRVRHGIPLIPLI